MKSERKRIEISVSGIWFSDLNYGESLMHRDPVQISEH